MHFPPNLTLLFSLNLTTECIFHQISENISHQISQHTAFSIFSTKTHHTYAYSTIPQHTLLFLLNIIHEIFLQILPDMESSHSNTCTSSCTFKIHDQLNIQALKTFMQHSSHIIYHYCIQYVHYFSRLYIKGGNSIFKTIMVKVSCCHTM